MNQSEGTIRSVTGLDPVQDVVCETLDISDRITINGTEPSSKQFLAYDPSTKTTKYQDIEPASDLDINALASLTTPDDANDELIIYDADAGTNKKITPENLTPSYSAGTGLTLNTNTFDFTGGDLGSINITLTTSGAGTGDMSIGGSLSCSNLAYLNGGIYTSNQPIVAGTGDVACGDISCISINTNDGGAVIGTGNLQSTGIINGGSFKMGGYFPIHPPGYEVASTSYRKIQIKPNDFMPNDDSSYYNIAVWDYNPTGDPSGFGALKVMTSSLELMGYITIPEGYEAVSIRLNMITSSGYSNISRYYYVYKVSTDNTARTTLLSGVGYSNSEYTFISPTSFSIDDYMVIKVNTTSTSDLFLGGWVKMQEES